MRPLCFAAALVAALVLSTPVPGQNAPIGVGTTNNTYYSTDAAFADATRQFRPWSTSALTPTGYPLAPATTYALMIAYPAGDYTLTWTGTGVITASGKRVRAQTAPEQRPDGTWVRIVQLAGDPGAVHLTASGLDPDDPLTSVHLWRPGLEGAVFSPEFVDRYRPFAAIRSLGWLDIDEGQAPARWEKRVTPQDWQWAGPKGVPIECLIALANETGRDLWINIPELADDHYISNCASLIYANLNPALNVYVEDSNEVWNGVYPQHDRETRAALADPRYASARGAFQALAWYHADRTVHLGSLFRQVFGSDAARVRPVFAGWCAVPGFAGQGLQWLQQQKTLGLIWGVACAPYVFLTKDQKAAIVTMDDFFAALNQTLVHTIAPRIAAHAALANEYGVQLVAYEGGQGEAECPQLSRMFVEAQYDPRMGQLYRDLIMTWQANGGGLFNHDCLIAPWGGGDGGIWSFFPRLDSAGGTAWAAVSQMLGVNP